jgi:hypothetical protein
MTEEERFKKVYNVYMNYEHELAQRGMEHVESIAVGLTQAYMLFQLAERTLVDTAEIPQTYNILDEKWDAQP